MKCLISTTLKSLESMSSLLTPVQPVLSLFARFYVAWVFFASGLTKIDDWESTLFLFEYEYQVPLLNFVLAAYLATIAELIAPVLLSLGLASRFNAIVLSVVNVVAVLSLEDMAPAAFNGHVIWGLLLLQVVFWGAGKLSVDHIVRSKMSRSSSSCALA